jgi:hypothetical protein
LLDGRGAARNPNWIQLEQQLDRALGGDQTPNTGPRGPGLEPVKQMATAGGVATV